MIISSPFKKNRVSEKEKLQKSESIGKFEKMTFYLLGDSNFRDLITTHKDDLQTESGVKIEFVQTTTVASAKAYLETLTGAGLVIFVAYPMNEISLKSRNNTKSREGIVEVVINDLCNQISIIAGKREDCLFILCQPFLRMDPPWIEGKMTFMSDYLKTTLNSTGTNNLHLGSVIEIAGEHLKSDNVHLNEPGIQKLKSVMTADIAIAKRELEILQNGVQNDESMEEAVTPVNVAKAGGGVEARALRKTPARRKRPYDDTEDSLKGKKKKGKEGIEAVLDKLDIMMERMDNDRVTNLSRFGVIEEKLAETVKAHEELKTEVEKLKTDDNCFLAAMREDLDAVENSNMRDTVIVKKLATEVEIPTGKKEMTNHIVKVGREIITEILGSDKGMKFIAPLFYNNNKRVPKEGERKELPPFKITFRLMEDSITFKEKCIAASKDSSHRLFKAYFAHQQTIGTRIRLNILWGIADALKKEKKDSWVTQSSPKPTLQVKDNGPLVKSYSYLDAVTTYGEKVDGKILEEATKLANRFFYGQVEKVFIILKD